MNKELLELLEKKKVLRSKLEAAKDLTAINALEEEIVVEITPADNAVGRGWRLLWQNHEYAVTSTDNTYRERTLITAKRLNPGE